MKLTPHLSFEAQAEEALNYYSTFFGAKTVCFHTYGELMPDAKPEHKNLVGYSLIEFGGKFMAFCDIMPGNATDTIKNSFSLDLDFDSAEELTEIFTKFAKDGTVTWPLAETSWAKCFGCVKDKFGVAWSFSFEK